MFAWLMDNLATVIVFTLLLAALVPILITVIRNKKKGKSSCSCGCSGCAMEGKCHKGS